MRILFVFALAFLLIGYSSPPAVRPIEEGSVSSIDYSSEASWCALPWRKDNADLVPDTSLKDEQATAQADVFYIHPTTYLIGKAWNASLADSTLNKRTDNGALKLQSTVFNGSCKVYAPRYRQAVLRSFFKDAPEAREALSIAYADVKKAFEYYLEHHNNGRPVIIAGHSQGARHAASLIKDFFDNKPLKEQLVAAYLIGMVIPCDTFKTIPPLSSRGETGCFISYNTMRWGFEKYGKRYSRACCVNPLSWTTNDKPADPSLHKGSVPLSFDRIDRNETSAQCYKSVLWAHAPQGPGYKILASGDNYHNGDVNLFWMNLREHVALQVKNHIEKAGKKK